MLGKEYFPITIDPPLPDHVITINAGVKITLVRMGERDDCGRGGDVQLGLLLLLGEIGPGWTPEARLL